MNLLEKVEYLKNRVSRVSSTVCLGTCEWCVSYKGFTSGRLKTLLEQMIMHVPAVKFIAKDLRRTQTAMPVIGGCTNGRDTSASVLSLAFFSTLFPPKPLVTSISLLF